MNVQVGGFVYHKKHWYKVKMISPTGVMAFNVTKPGKATFISCDGIEDYSDEEPMITQKRK